MTSIADVKQIKNRVDPIYGQLSYSYPIVPPVDLSSRIVSYLRRRALALARNERN